MKIVFYIILLSCSLINIKPTTAQQPIIIKMGNVISEPKGTLMPFHANSVQKLFARKVHEYTDGQVKWEILEGKREDIPVFMMPNMTAEGNIIQATNVPAIFMPRVSELLIQSIPFLFESEEHTRRFVGSEPQRWMYSKVEESYNVKVLGSTHHSNAVSINSITPILEPKDFAGKILNDFSESWLPLWKNIKPKEITYMGYSEAVAGGLVAQNATTEVTIGLLQNNNGQKLYDRYKHLTLASNMYNIYYMILINNEVWSSLSEFQQEGLNRAIKDAQEASIAFHMDTMINAIEIAQSEGVEIHFLTHDQHARWKAEFYPKMLASVMEKSENPEETADMIEKIKALVNDIRWQ